MYDKLSFFEDYEEWVWYCNAAIWIDLIQTEIINYSANPIFRENPKIASQIINLISLDKE